MNVARITNYLNQELLRSNNFLGIKKSAIFENLCVVDIVCPEQK
jgi:hypothetical protein